MLKRQTMFCYGFLAMPMAFIAISLFVFIPKIYHEQYGISLLTVSLVFIVSQVTSMLAMPYIGILLDRLNLRRIYRKKIIYLCLPLIGLSFFFLVFPPFQSIISLISFYLISCILYAIIAINYYAISVELTREYKSQNFLSGYREMFALFGYLTAAVFMTFAVRKYTFVEAYNNVIFLLIFALFTAGILMHFVKSKSTFMFHSDINIRTIFDIIRSHKHTRFLTILLLNFTSLALTITTTLYYVKYVIEAETNSGYYFMTYHMSAILSIPYWVKFANRNGKKNTWLLAMIISGFFSASCYFLGEGDRLEFYLVSAVLGFCLGADIMLSPSIYTDNVEKREKAASYYSLFIMVNKAAFSSAVLVSLIVVGIYGLEAKSLAPDDLHTHGVEALSVVHCLLPAILKFAAAWLLVKNKIDVRVKK